MEKIESREQAILNGNRYFFTGKECRNGHIAKRYVANYACQKCLRTNTEGARLALKHRLGALSTRVYHKLHAEDIKVLDGVVAALRAARGQVVDPSDGGAAPPVAMPEPPADPYKVFNMWKQVHGVVNAKQLCKTYDEPFPPDV